MDRKQLIEKINIEYDEFKANTLNLAKEEIFERSYEIDFKTNLKEYLTNDDTEISDTVLENLSLIDGSILDELYGVYVESDTYYTFDDICEEILGYFEDSYDDAEID